MQPGTLNRRELLQTYKDLIGRRQRVISDLWAPNRENACRHCSADASSLYSLFRKLALKETAMLIHWIVLTLALLIVSYLYSGVRVASLPAAIIAAAVLGILNALVRPVLQFFALPITVLTLGLFYFVINGLMLYADRLPGGRLRCARLRGRDPRVYICQPREFDSWSCPQTREVAT